jgi:hypothetical protein
MADVKDLVGQICTSVEQNAYDEIIFTLKGGRQYHLYHRDDCCESVTIEDICGDLAYLVGAPILMAEESSDSDWPSNVPQPEYPPESYTWTFYKFATIKGYVTIRWYGTSNGYYSERVTFELLSN